MKININIRIVTPLYKDLYTINAYVNPQDSYDTGLPAGLF